MSKLSCQQGANFTYLCRLSFSKANLELNKETLAEELVCLLDVAALPQDVASFKRLIESFFIAGAARIDLIGEVMDLDNEIGGYNFDIPLLEETEKTKISLKGTIEGPHDIVTPSTSV